ACPGPAVSKSAPATTRRATVMRFMKIMPPTLAPCAIASFRGALPSGTVTVTWRKSQAEPSARRVKSWTCLGHCNRAARSKPKRPPMVAGTAVGARASRRRGARGRRERRRRGRHHGSSGGGLRAGGAAHAHPEFDRKEHTPHQDDDGDL